MTNETDMVEVVMIAKPGVGELVTACAANEITFGELCEQVAAMGYKTTSLYEMVIAAQPEQESDDETTS